MTGRNANGEGTISFDEERKRYVGRITTGFSPTGKPIRRKFVGKTRIEVVQRMAAARRAADAGMPVPNDRLTVAVFLDRWLGSLSGRVAESTEHVYRSRVRLYLVPQFGHVPLTKLTPAHVSDLLSAMETKGLSAETRRHTRAVLRAALLRAEQEGLVTRNVAQIAAGPRVSRAEGRSLTVVEARALLAAASTPLETDPRTPGRRPVAAERLQTALLLALSLGLRRGEVLGLRWDDIDFESQIPSLDIRQQLVRRPSGLGLALVELKTHRSRRSVALPVGAVTSLRGHRARQNAERLAVGTEWTNGDGLVFTTPYGTPIDPRNFNRVLSAVAKRAGLGHWHPHELRHSAASILLASGVPLEMVSAELVKRRETTSHADLMSASGVGSLIQAMVGSFGGVGRRWRNRDGLAA